MCPARPIVASAAPMIDSGSVVWGGSVRARAPTVGALSAARAPSLGRLDVALWPEYARPAVLVLYRARLDPASPLPARVRLPMPASVGPPHAVASRATDGRLLLADHAIEVEGDWAWVEVTTQSHQVQPASGPR